MQLLGIHHVTAITARIRENLRFYTGTLGMRLVKRSVNQDDVRAYHLFYGDAVGSPGTDLTFFDWPMPPERRGARSIARTSLRVTGEGTLAWWRTRLAEAGVEVDAVVQRNGRPALDFEDPEGQRLALVDDGGKGPEPRFWPESPVPSERQIRGLGPMVLSVPELAPTESALIRVLGMRREGDYEISGGTRGESTDSSTAYVYAMGDGGPHAEVHLVVEPSAPTVRQGAGGVHHMAFRVPDIEYDAWADRLDELRVPNSGKVDRFYFRSLYFREPNGILFELATEGPGFAVDEDVRELGQNVALPPFLESRRDEIEAKLQPLD